MVQDPGPGRGTVPVPSVPCRRAEVVKGLGPRRGTVQEWSGGEDGSGVKGKETESFELGGVSEEVDSQTLS